METAHALPASPPKQRDSNLELYRIIVMLLIIAHHYVVNSGLSDLMYEQPGAPNTLFLFLFGAWGKSGINCFVLISGYFMCTSRITLKKFAKLVLEYQFYKLVIYSVFWLTGYDRFTMTGLKNLLLPVTSVNNGFTSCYILFYLFIPFLNILIQNLSEKNHLLLILLCLFIYTGLGSVPGFSVSKNYVTWFIVLYLVAAFIRLHPKNCFQNSRLWGLAMTTSLALSVLSILSALKLGQASKAYFYLSDCNKILALTNGVTSFLFFKNLKIGHSRLINALGASTFGVLLIHANGDAMRRWLWKTVLNNVSMFDSPWLIVHAVGSVLIIFALCSGIDLLRIHLLESPFFRLWDRCSEKALPRYRKWEATILQRLQIKE